MNLNPIKATLKDLIARHEAGTLVGVFEISNADYHNAPGISKSGLDDLAVCPAYFKYNRENPAEPTESLEEGQAIHTAILEPSKFSSLYAIAPPELDRRGTKAWNEFEAKNAGKAILKAKDGERIAEMVKVARSHSRASLLEGHKELSFFWKAPETGLLCKCRVDNLTDKGIIVDYKSCHLAMPARKWATDLTTYRYHVQGAFYPDGVRHALEQAGIALEMPPLKFLFFAQEKTAPFLVKPWLLGDSSAELGRQIYQKELKIIAECEKTGIWPGYPEKIEIIEARDYAWERETEKERA